MPTADGKRISQQAHEIEYWTKKWGISTRQLAAAKRVTGSTSVKTIEAYLKKKGKI